MTLNMHVQLNHSHALRLAASAFAAAALVAGIAASQATAAPPPSAKLQHGVLRIHGSHANDAIMLRLATGDAGTLEVDLDSDGSADASFAHAQIGEIDVNAGHGNDRVQIDERNGPVNADIPTTIHGGDGDDDLAGGSGAETLFGDDGNDTIDGNRGADIGIMGDGDDTFVWDPGDGSDVVEGEVGHDTMLFNGAPGAEQFDLSPNGQRLRFFRTQGAITMDTAGVEQVDVTALGG